MGRRLSIGAAPATSYADYTPAAVTDQARNHALDDRDGSYALRLITHAASVLQDVADKMSDAELRSRPSQIQGRTLGAAVPGGLRRRHPRAAPARVGDAVEAEAALVRLPVRPAA